jgi:hypothetical protein
MLRLDLVFIWLVKNLALGSCRLFAVKQEGNGIKFIELLEPLCYLGAGFFALFLVFHYSTPISIRRDPLLHHIQQPLRA